MDYIVNHWQIIALIVGVIILLVSYRAVLALCGVILVPDDSVGVITKKFVIVGKNRRLPAGRIIALHGKAAEALAKCGGKLVQDIVAGGGATDGTLVDVLLANVIRDGTRRSVP